METKVCTKCNEELPATLEYFYKHKSCKYGLDARCKECIAIVSRNYRLKNLKRIREREKKYFKENISKIYERRKEYFKSDKGKEQKRKHYKKNQDKYVDMAKKYHKKSVENISDFYVAKIMRKSVHDIPKEVIETKRLIIQLRRTIKQ